MDKIKNSLFGYNRTEVNNMISQKDNLIKTQQQDIDYLRQENQELKQKELKFYKAKNSTSKNSKQK